MKNMILILCFASLASLQTHAQDSTQTIKKMIDAKRYNFVPSTMMPSRGGTKQLTSDYFFKLSGDTLKVYLPYFGRAYSATMNSSDNGFDFTTTKFTYNVSAGKKNSYNVVVKTTDKLYNTTFNLTVYDNGSAYLYANNSNREPVSYNGNIRKK